MSKSSSAKLTFSLLIAAFVLVALCSVDLSSALAQNANTSEGGNMQGHNMANMGSRRATRRANRRARRANRRANRRARMMNTNAGMDANTNANMTGDTTMQATNAAGSVQDTTNTGGGTTEDLSGTYTGRISMPAHGVNNEEATLTITGNTYTLTSGSMNHSGRFIAVTTRGYTGVTMELGPGEGGNPGRFISVRARRLGTGGLSLMSVPGESESLSFTTSGAASRGRRRR
ncbi:MAG TPA: hypothetical protein VGV59_03235 [Pyrinomonadaceae bacterium]|nr:hypothetical protein [Pyrinomonadaceae bacterium]